jgi:glutamate N-acetyltransferase/amino-acid N-acetyltransferase
MFKIVSLKGGIGDINGFFCDGINCGLRPEKEHEDLGFIRSEGDSFISAIFTENRFKASPIIHAQRYIEDDGAFEGNFILVNAKNANAMTGKKGVEDIEEILSHLPTTIGIKNPVMSSTGVIGYRLPKDKILSGLESLSFDSKNSKALSRAIMTTDKFNKTLRFKVVLEDGNSFEIAGVAKGAGMINPSMATMLCFIATDADVPREKMHSILKEASDKSFNRISVDGDTSTNDSLFLISNGKSGVYDDDAFIEAINRMTFEFAMMILRDGEGANKVVSFEVKGAKDNQEAQTVATNLSNSLLVKTALFGEDPNWGRIASTVGASGVECSEESLKIYYDDLLIYDNEHRELDKEREDRAYKIMKQESFKVICDLGVGDGTFIAYGCDLSYEYVKINAEYRT